MNLSALRSGESAVVKSLSAGADMRRRLLDIGLVNSTRVECVGRAPLGEMGAYLIRGAVIAIRDEDAALIKVEKCEGNLYGTDL